MLVGGKLVRDVSLVSPPATPSERRGNLKFADSSRFDQLSSKIRSRWLLSSFTVSKAKRLNQWKMMWNNKNSADLPRTALTETSIKLSSYFIL